MKESPGVGQLKNLGELRDGFLIGGAVLYGVGYLVWSLNSFFNHLGLLPALDVQYFVAGVVPILALLAAFLVRHLVRRLVEGVWTCIERSKWLSRPIILIMGAVFGYTYATLLDLNLIFAAALALSFPVLAFFRRSIVPVPAEGGANAGSAGIAATGSVVGGFGRGIARIIGLVLPWILALGLIGGFFIPVVYPEIPQEFGGVKPRCVLLDLVKKEVSPSTLQQLAPPPGQEASQKPARRPAVVRSTKVWVYYSGGGAVLVKRNRSSDASTYDLSKDAVHAMVSCPSG